MDLESYFSSSKEARERIKQLEREKALVEDDLSLLRAQDRETEEWKDHCNKMRDAMEELGFGIEIAPKFTITLPINGQIAEMKEYKIKKLLRGHSL